MTKLVIPKGMVIFPGETEGVATENIHVSFDGSPDEVAAVLCQNNQKNLLPLLEHEDGDKLVRYTRQGNRVETPVLVKSAPKTPPVEIPADKKPANKESEKTEAVADAKPITPEVENDAPKQPEIITTPVPAKNAAKTKNRQKTAKTAK